MDRPLSVALTACGGGGSILSGSSSISGGQVRLTCAAGTSPAVTTNADGSYTIDVSNATLPCIARVTYMAGVINGGTVSGTTLTPLVAGSCTITADQSGNSSYAAAATVTRTVTVSNPASTASAASGKVLYASNNCGMCHGTPPATLNVLNGANNPSLIRSAINGIGSMNGYASLTDAQLADIAAYLATPNI
mgnify:CR=1 FL=1